MKNLNKYILIILIILPFVFIYRAFFTDSPLVWGDAPYFYPENLKELFNRPMSWDFRNNNFGASQNLVLWLYLPTFLFGLLNNLITLNSEILIRLIFFFPAVALAFLGSYYLTRKYVVDKKIPLLGSILYTFNTYFLLLIDGGQIGVALAYGIFPFALITLKNLGSKFSLKNFTLATVVFGILTNVDLRVAILSLFSAFVIYFFEAFTFRNFNALYLKLIRLLPVVITVIFLDAFWLLSFLTNIGGTAIYQQTIGHSLITIYDGIFLYSPHFPRNEFGQVSNVPYYFGLVPLLIFGNLLIRKTKEGLLLSLALLVFIFLVKGEAEPFGQIYSFITFRIPFGFSFRDSTKFFIPIFLISSTLFSMTVNEIFIKLGKRKILSTYFYLACYAYLLFLIWPALFGKLTGVLASKPFDQNYKAIYKYLKNDQIFFRTLWFPERPPLAFSMIGKEALGASIFYKEVPFSSMIEGEYDLFYFLHDSMLTDWFRLLGIKYAFFPEDERKKTWTDQELENRKLFLDFIDDRVNFKRLGWEIDFPGYLVSDPLPKIFGQEKILFVIGDSSIYNFLNDYIKDFDLPKQGFLFLEDGILNPYDLEKVRKDSGILVLKDREKEDIAMSFLQKDFLKNDYINRSEWGYYNPDEYLKGKYQLLKNGIDTNDLLYNRGFHFSTIKNEKITYSFEVKDRGKYYIALRSISASESAGIKIKQGSKEKIYKNDRFKWNTLGPFDLQKGDYNITVENLGGFNALNVLAVFSEGEKNKVYFNVERLQDKFGKLDISKIDDLAKLGKQLSQLQTIQLAYNQKDPTEYSINSPEKSSLWIVFSDHYNANWELKGSKSYPMYSMINGFYTDFASQKKVTLRFKSQDVVDLGIKISIVSLLVLSAIILANLKRMR